MKVELVKDDSRGKAGAKLEGASVWRLAFPCKGMVAKPADREAAIAIDRDIHTTTGATRKRLEDAMLVAGTHPSQFVGEPEPERKTKAG